MDFSFVRLDHVQLAAPEGSEEEARAFYKDMLLFTEIEKPTALQKNGGVWFQAGDVHLHIGIDHPFTPAKKAHPAIEVHNIDAFMSYLMAKDVHIQPDDRLPGAKRFYMEDPFQNRLEFLEWTK